MVNRVIPGQRNEKIPVCTPAYNIIYCSKEKIESVDSKYSYRPHTKAAKRDFAIGVADIRVAGINTYCLHGIPVGQPFMQKPLKQLENIHINFLEKEGISELNNKTIYERAESAKMTGRLIYTEGNVAIFYRSNRTKLSSNLRRSLLMPAGKD